MLGALACQSSADVHREPTASAEKAPAAVTPAAPAATTPAATTPAATAAAATAPSGAPAAPAASASNGQVGLAKYEEAAAAPKALAAPSAASASAAAPSTPAPAADAPAAKAVQGQTVQGSVVSEEPFSTWLQAVSPVAAGSPASVEVVLVAKEGYHCNADYPHKFKLAAAPAGLTYPESVVKGMQVTPQRSVLKVPVQAQAAGKATVSGTLQFSVCNDERCLIEKKDLSLALEVK